MKDEVEPAGKISQKNIVVVVGVKDGMFSKGKEQEWRMRIVLSEKTDERMDGSRTA